MEVHGVSEPGCFTPPDTPSPGGADPGLTALRLRRPPCQGRCRPLAAGGAGRDGAAEERRPERGPELPLRAGSCEAGERRRVPPCLPPALPPLPAATRPVRRPQTKGGSGDEPGQGGGGSPATAASFPAPEEPAERGWRRARRGLTRIRLKRLLSLGGSGTDGMMRAGGRPRGSAARGWRGGCRCEEGEGGGGKEKAIPNSAGRRCGSGRVAAATLQLIGLHRPPRRLPSGAARERGPSAQLPGRPRRPTDAAKWRPGSPAAHAHRRLARGWGRVALGRFLPALISPQREGLVGSGCSFFFLLLFEDSAWLPFARFPFGRPEGSTLRRGVLETAPRGGVGGGRGGRGLPPSEGVKITPAR